MLTSGQILRIFCKISWFYGSLARLFSFEGNPMSAFFRGLCRLFCVVRDAVVSFFFVLFVLVCFSVMSLLQSQSKNEPPAFEKGALMLNLDGYLADNHDEQSELYRTLQSELGGSSEPLKISTFDVVRAIRKAENDDRITGIVLELGYFDGADLPALEFVGSALNEFKRSGKPIFAIGEYFTQQQYFLASFADKIFLNQAGFVEITGLSYSTLYFKSLLEKIEAQPHIFRVGTYKSAVEPFIRDDMSPEAKKNASLWLNQLWQNFSQKVIENRQLANTQHLLPPAAEFLHQYREVKGDDAQYALKQKWVTHIATSDEIQRELVAQFGEDDDGSYQRIDFFSYTEHLSDRFDVQSANKIAVINIEGEIVFGTSDEHTAGSDTIIPLLREARLDDDIQAVILRINSPGGSAIASELIRQEAEAIQKAGKPVVASMGGMAASGGYWIAATSDKIIASPSTITGSIGIFGLAMTFEKTAKKLGINEDGVATSVFANQSEFKTLPKEQGELIQISIENGYQRFLELVARGRGMTVEAVDNIAQGQVWLGQEAHSHRLVDELGDFDLAYGITVELINQQREANNQPTTDQFSVQWLTEPQEDFVQNLLNGFKQQITLQFAKQLNLPMAKKLQEPLGLLSRFNDPKQSYLYCLNCGTVK